MAKPPPATKRTRDRESTERAILTAARQVLAEEGFQGFGVNAIARAAQCDKQLVYRYFGGADGLVEAIGADLARWWSEALATPGSKPAASYAELIERLGLAMLAALRSDPLVQKIAVWEIADPSPMVAQLTAARGKAMLQWMTAQRGELSPPEGVDAPAFNALVVAGVQHLVLAASAAGQFSGLPLKTEKDWDRVRAALRKLVTAAYS
jgi:AcrR family transcriptional regulator